MRKIAYIAMVILFLAACTQSNVKEQNAEDNFHVGTQGISLNFVQNAPPSKIYEGDNLDVSVELWNKGAYPDSNILEGKLAISGFDPSAINGQWDGADVMPSDLVGKSAYNPSGGYGIMTYEASNINVPFDANPYTVTLIVHACYKYATIASPLVCIDSDPYSVVSEEKVCHIGDQSLSSGQGAPVSVTKIEEEVGSDTIYFRIYIRNAGGGTIIGANAYDSCPFDLNLEDLNTIVVNVDTSFDTRPRCTPAGTSTDPVRLINGQGYIFCSMSKPNTNSAYQTPLNIRLDYVYSNSISKKVEIISLN
jgi:hypothetical protein